MLSINPDLDFVVNDRCRNQLIKLEVFFAVGRSSELNQSNPLPCLAVVEPLVFTIRFLLSVKNTLFRSVCGYAKRHQEGHTITSPTASTVTTMPAARPHIIPTTNEITS